MTPKSLLAVLVLCLVFLGSIADYRGNNYRYKNLRGTGRSPYRHKLRRVISLSDEEFYALASMHAVAQATETKIVIRDEDLVAADLSHFVYNNERLTNSRFSLVSTHQRKETKFVVVEQPEQKRAFVAFRGTKSAEGWINNLKFDLTKCPYGNCGSLHRGFLEEYKPEESELMKRIAPLVQKGYKVILTGHSKGAAHASIAAVHLAQVYGKAPFSLVLFGSPRIGNSAFASAVERSVSRGVRFVTSTLLGSDFVTLVPPKTFNYADSFATQSLSASAWNGFSGHNIKYYIEALERLYKSQTKKSYSRIWNAAAYTLDDNDEPMIRITPAMARIIRIGSLEGQRHFAPWE